MQSDNLISVALVDDDLLIVNLLQGFLAAQEGIDVIYTAGGGEEFLALLEKTEKLPDVIVLDLKMKGISGIEVTEILKTSYPSIKVIVVSSHYSKTFMGFMLKTGAVAFAPKGISPVTLVEMIREVHARGFYFMEGQVEMISEQISGKSPRPDMQENTLSERETEILKLICQQKTAKEIGDQLFITQRTVEGHKNNLFVKTGAKNIAGLVIYALQHRVIQIDELPLI